MDAYLIGRSVGVRGGGRGRGRVDLDRGLGGTEWQGALGEEALRREAVRHPRELQQGGAEEGGVLAVRLGGVQPDDGVERHQAHAVHGAGDADLKMGVTHVCFTIISTAEAGRREEEET